MIILLNSSFLTAFVFLCNDSISSYRTFPIKIHQVRFNTISMGCLASYFRHWRGNGVRQYLNIKIDSVWNSHDNSCKILCMSILYLFTLLSNITANFISKLELVASIYIIFSIFIKFIFNAWYECCCFWWQFLVFNRLPEVMYYSMQQMNNLWAPASFIWNIYLGAIALV